ncbi:hypothetical protein P152DRAFT_473671 [Eremomyces bilateralis CBS 781.70]|uniref:INO80 complex subunit B-like conserved region domain-containing protein n=1 Tax=Eremomyces bilateralis CBS 781.70 TaxID=1392243 RepID=A0A6G1G319_9PEZI|nr:uncharacterized protein P152DRAFT_473671 [Eremomyces bilateralis CBS 781.70]KAF1812507.1 hypothetical protein P152DRAFT_473671 [Eremomyces bilateralis CBS 781.70]
MSSRQLRSRPELTSSATSSRPRRGVAGPSASIERTNPSSDTSRQSIRLTVKAPPSKLRQVINGGDVDAGPINRPVRNGRRKAIVESSDEEMDSEQPTDVYGGEDGDEDDADDIEEKTPDDDDEDMEDAEGEDAEDDADGDDVDMDDLPPRPPPSARSRAPPAKPTVKVTPPDAKSAVPNSRVVPDDDDDEDELSELDSQEDLEEEDDEEEDDAEGEEAEGDEDLAEEDVEGEDDDDLDSDGRTPASKSRSNTPDLTKLTRRQRAALIPDGVLMALSNEAQKKKHLTAEEHAMRRVEMARRRKNLSEKRNEEEKMDTINRLLKKQAPKRRNKSAAEIAAEAAEEGGEYVVRAPPLYARFVQSATGTAVAAPDEWLEAPVGRVFTGPSGRGVRGLSSRMVEEVA